MESVDERSHLALVKQQEEEAKEAVAKKMQEQARKWFLDIFNYDALMKSINISSGCSLVSSAFPFRQAVRTLLRRSLFFRLSLLKIRWTCHFEHSALEGDSLNCHYSFSYWAEHGWSGENCYLEHSVCCWRFCSWRCRTGMSMKKS